MSEFIGLRSKLYAYKTLNGKEAKKLKILKRRLFKRNLFRGFQKMPVNLKIYL